MLRMERVQKDVLDGVERTLRAEFMSNLARSTRRDAHETMADIFNSVDRLAEVARGTFREDLLYRLNVVSLRVPPLRERPGDVAALAEYFARRYAEVNGLPYRPLSRVALLRLAAHGWRGNVRELENTIHRAVLLADGDEIDQAAVELGPQGSLAGTFTGPGSLIGAAAQAAYPDGRQAGIASLVGRRMDDVERDLIIETLSHTLGNRTHAATILGISIRALRNKLHDYGAQGVAVPPAAGVAA
jgi:two-component system response regulator FlrC